MDNSYDIIIIGAGMAGLTAGIYASRGNMKVLILESKQYGGQIVNSPNVENYPGFINISGASLAKYFYDQAISLGCEVKFEKVIKVSEREITTDKNVYQTKTIIIANGLVQKKLGVPNEDNYIGRGLSYCATCDGAFYRDKDVLVVGSGNTALEDAIFLSNIAHKVYIMIRKNEFKGNINYVEKIKELDNVEVITKSTVKKIIGDDVVSSVIYDNEGKEKELGVSGIFVAIGHIPNNEMFKDLIALDAHGYILSDDCNTNRRNIFVAGDTRTKDLRQIITSASDGAIAACNAIAYINKNM